MILSAAIKKLAVDCGAIDDVEMTLSRPVPEGAAIDNAENSTIVTKLRGVFMTEDQLEVFYRRCSAARRS